MRRSKKEILESAKGEGIIDPKLYKSIRSTLIKNELEIQKKESLEKDSIIENIKNELKDKNLSFLFLVLIS